MNEAGDIASHKLFDNALFELANGSHRAIGSEQKILLVWHGDEPLVSLILGSVNYTSFLEKNKRAGFREFF
jgi:hypothetical protein